MVCLIDTSITGWGQSLGGGLQAGESQGSREGDPKAVLQHPHLIPFLHVVCHDEQGG